MAKETVKWFSQDKGNGGTKDNVRDELDDAAGRGRHDRDNRKDAAPEEVGQPGSGGVKDNVRDRKSQSAKPGPGLAGSGFIASIDLSLRTTREPLAS
jgi:hypothetical protein